MVTKRSSGSKAEEMRRAYKQFLTDFATTITVLNYSHTLDSMGRITATSTTTTNNVKAEIQWLNKHQLDRVNTGNVKIGDGMLFVLHNQTLNVEDEVTYNSETYRVVTQIEGEVVEGSVIYKGFIIRKNAQT